MQTSEPTAAGPRPPDRIPLARGHLLLVGSGSFGVSMLPAWVMTLRQACPWDIRVCLTRAASALVAPAALAAASRNPVSGPDWPTERGGVPHQELAEWADLVVVAPATTNFLAKCAHGMPDNLALSVVLSTRAPVVLAPAVPDAVLGRPSLQRTLRLLAEDGYHVVPTQSGTSVHSGKRSDGGLADLRTVLQVAATAVAAARPAPAADPAPAAAPPDPTRSAPLAGLTPGGTR